MENEIKNLKHIAVIIDGNRRYAKSKLLPTFLGHEKGAEKVKEFLRWCRELNIKEATIYALSTENLKRDSEELSHLFRIFKKFFKDVKESKEIKEKSIKIRFIGDLSLVPKDIKELALELEKETKSNQEYTVNFCFAYGGRLELTQTFNKLLKSGKKEITEQDITNNLWLSSEPELIIRTGGKSRTSNFLPWQTVYSEWMFLDKMWPEIEKQDILDCLGKFAQIQRNFGK
jgi:undecaprenyl diphosphate synthase/tritrans,polycis-undecaprenyl-diphosphate synthase [geranylgeranyl-diphosphate specific]